MKLARKTIMKFRIEIDCDNAAFAGRMLYDETADTLVVAERLVRQTAINPDHSEGRILHDRNGNTVGRAWFEDDGS